MIPITAITGATIDASYLYVAILGILLLIATWLRLQFQILKTWHIPSALIAGVIGLIIGPYFIGILPKEVTAYWSSLSGRLIVIVFAPLLMGRRMVSAKRIMNVAAPAVLWSYGATAIQYAYPLLLGVLLFTPLWGINEMFGTIIEQGWAGGHGTAGGMARVFEELNWADGTSLSVTSATVGLIFGIVAGVILINIGVRKGWTKYLHHQAGVQNVERELYSFEDKMVGSYNTVNPNVIDSYAFHMGLISVAVFLGWIFNWVIKYYLNFSVAWFVTAMFSGFLLQSLLNKTKWGNAVDKKTMGHLQGMALEFLVAGAVASVNIPVVIKYAAPLIIQQAGMMSIQLFLNIWLCRRILAEDWFENSMLLFGTYTGVVATGLLLLRTCDPEMRSNATEVLAARVPFSSWALGGGLLTSITPGLVVRYGGLKVGLVYLFVFAATMVLYRLMGWWYPPQVNESNS